MLNFSACLFICISRGRESGWFLCLVWPVPKKFKHFSELINYLQAQKSEQEIFHKNRKAGNFNSRKKGAILREF